MPEGNIALRPVGPNKDNIHPSFISNPLANQHNPFKAVPQAPDILEVVVDSKIPGLPHTAAVERLPIILGGDSSVEQLIDIRAGGDDKQVVRGEIGVGDGFADD